MNQTFNYFQQEETPALILCTPNKEERYVLPLAYQIKNTQRYNAVSELTFQYPQSSDGGETIDPSYAYILGKMLVLVENIGYYVIASAQEDSDGAIPIKSVSCLSLESELLSARVTGLNGTYQFAALLQTVLELKPSWVIGSIDASLLPLYRTFSVNNSTVLNFLLSDMEKAYGAIFTFDTTNRTVSAITNILPFANTNIFLSYDNLIKNIQYKEITDEICTAMSCYGAGDLDIRNVNPLGNTTIYDFTYYKTLSWMSQGLINALNVWEANVAIQQPIYATKLTNLETHNGQLLILQTEMVDLNGQLKSMTDVREARIQQGLPTTEIDAQIVAQQISITSKGIDIASEQQIIDGIKIELRKIVHSLFFASKISFDNFEEDVASMAVTIGGMLTSWTNIYTSTSTSPGFNPALLVSSTPTINILMLEANNEIAILLSALANGFSAYPLSDANVAIVTGYINDELGTLNSLYALLQSVIPNTSITASIDNIRTTLTAYLEIITYSGNMTYAQYLELTNYIFQNSYTNSNIVTNNLMTPVEVQTQSQYLYDQAVTVLAKTSQPRYEFTGDFANFIALQDFSSFTDELELGKVINIRKDDSTTIEAALLELVITYDNPTDFSMTFSNRFRLDNSEFIYGDILGAAAQLGSSSGATALTEGNIAGWTVSAVNISIPNAQLSSKGYMSFGITPPETYGNNEGAWFGYDNAPKFSLYSNINNYLQWDSSKLLVKAENFTLDSLGNITATNATLSGTITSGDGDIGGWIIGATTLQKLTAGVGIVLDSSIPAIKVGDTTGTYILIDGLNKSISSSNFVTSASGFYIASDTGSAEFNDIIMRGKLKTSVFESGTISAVGGTLAVLNADVLAVDMTASDGDTAYTLVDEGGNVLIDGDGNTFVTEPLATLSISGDSVFSVGNILRMKDKTDDEWLRVDNISQLPLYIVSRDMESSYAANTNPLWKKGQAVVNYGSSGGGGVILSAGVSPSINVFTHGGSPWSTIYNHASLQEDLSMFGSDVSAADTTAFTVFHIDQTYNSELMGAGDILLGSNTSGYANVLWDVSTKQLKFRGGSTTQAYIDTDGSIVGGNGLVKINNLGIGIGNSSPQYPLDVGATLLTPYNYSARFTRCVDTVTSGAASVMVVTKSSGDMQDTFGTGLLLAIQDATMADPQYIGGIYAIRNGADNTGKIHFVVNNAGSWAYKAILYNTGDFYIVGDCSAQSFTDRP